MTSENSATCGAGLLISLTYVRLCHLRRHNRCSMVFRLSRHPPPNARRASDIVVHRGADGLPRRATGSGSSSASTSPQRAIHRSAFVRADLFIVALVLSVTFGLVWAFLQTAGDTAWTIVFLALYLIATTVLFGSIPWVQILPYVLQARRGAGKRVAEANGTRSNLPPPARHARNFRERAAEYATLLIGPTNGLRYWR